MNGRALIFELFDKISEKEAQCKLCEDILPTVRGSTTNIRHHALKYHETEWTDIQETAQAANIKKKRSETRQSTSRALVYLLFKKQGDLAKCRICSKVLSVLDGTWNSSKCLHSWLIFYVTIHFR